MFTKDQSDRLFFPVEVVPTVSLLPEGFKPFPRRAKAVVVHPVDSNPQAVYFGSKGYTLAPNRDIYEPALQALSAEYSKIEISVETTGNVRFFVDFVIKDMVVQVSKGDLISPRIRIQNSYDGGLKYGSIMGAWRYACTNKLIIIGDVTSTTKMMHLASIAEYLSGGGFMSEINEFIQAFSTNTEIYKELAQTKINEDQIQVIVGEVIEETGFPKKQVDNVIATAIEDAQGFKSPMNLWLLYNAFNSVLDKSSDINMQEHRKVNLDTKVLTALSQY